mmetsp:Transcript_1595/g.2194  ORF Transcript_1595/g.2194 Transcript_1595/m.2194 type:complete len:264 (+) Transcript_1595:94-885(+)
MDEVKMASFSKHLFANFTGKNSLVKSELVCSLISREKHHLQQLNHFSSLRRVKRRKLERPKASVLQPKPIDQSKKIRKPLWKYLSIFPEHPHEYDPKYVNTDASRSSLTISDHYTIWKMALSEYKKSHEGFLLPKRKLEEAEDQDSLSNLVEEHRSEIRSNITKNVEFLRSEGDEALKSIKKETGIGTVEDLRKWAGEQLTLANECLKEFMSGYRHGRDEEIDKMINEYFKEVPSTLDHAKEKIQDILTTKRRRKPKRRVRTL